MSSSNIPEIRVGMTFDSWNEFAERYENFLKSNFHPVFVVKDSRTAENYNKLYPKSGIPLSCKYKHVTFQCVHGTKIKSLSKGLRSNQSTLKKNCNANLTIKYLRREKTFRVTKCDFNHTNDDGAIVHSVSQDLFQMTCSQVGFRGINYTISRVVNCGFHWKATKEKPEAKAQMEKTELLMEYGAKVQDCRLQFKSETGITISTKTLINKKAKIKSKLNNLLKNEKFLNELHIDESSGEIVVEKVVHKNEIQLIYFQFHWMKELFDKYPEHILMDGTYSLVNTRMPLYTIMIVDGNNNSIPVAFCLLSQESSLLLDYFLSFFVKHNPKSISAVESYMTDKDFKEMSVLAKYFPKAKHELCLFHVLKSMKTMVNESDVPKLLKDLAKTLLERMVYAESNEQFETELEEFETAFEGHQLKTDFFNRWYPIKELWAGHIRQETLNFGDTTNNRMESFNQKLKSYINRYSSMDVFYKQLKLYMTHITEKIQRDCFDEQSKQYFNTMCDIDKNIEAVISETATRFAGKIVKEELSKSSEVQSAEFDYNLNGFKVVGRSGKIYFTTYDCCSCPDFLMRRIPCRHVFYVRINSNQPAFESSLLSLRWTKRYFFDACNKAFPSDKKVIVKEKKNVPVKYIVPNEEWEKYLTAFKLGNKLVEILKTSSKQTFTPRKNVLNHLISMWSSGKNIDNDHINFVTVPESECRKDRKNIGDDVHDDNSSKKLKDTVPTTPNRIQTSTSREVLPTTIKVCGRPKGSYLTAIGKIRKAPKPSQRKKKRHVQTALPTSRTLPTVAADINEQPLITKPHSVQQQTSITNDQQVWVKIDKYYLYTEHQHCLCGNTWLDDMLINSAQSILQKKYGSSIKGLQDCLLAQMKPPQFDVVNGPFVQICNVNNNHWVCIAGYSDPKDKHVVLDIYDSMSNKINYIYADVISIASSLTRHINYQNIEVRQHNVTQQPNTSDCGLFAIAFAKYRCMGVNPCHLDIIQSRIRSHLYEGLQQYSLNSETLPPFPATPNQGRQCVKSSTLVEKVYCKCRKPISNVMILCVICKEQFHHNCIQGQVRRPYKCERCEVFSKKYK